MPVAIHLPPELALLIRGHAWETMQAMIDDPGADG